MYKNVNCGIAAPKDLAGKRIGLSGYQNTLGVRAKGDLTHFYGVDGRSVTWITPGKEVVEVKLPDDLKIESRASMAEIEKEFVDGKIQAMFVSRLPKPFRDGHINVARLFDNPQAEEERYLREEGYFPIMHVLAFARISRALSGAAPSPLRHLLDRAGARSSAGSIPIGRWSWGAGEWERQNQLCARTLAQWNGSQPKEYRALCAYSRAGADPPPFDP
jgi:hypothetical protein